MSGFLRWNLFLLLLIAAVRLRPRNDHGDDFAGAMRRWAERCERRCQRTDAQRAARLA